MDTSEQRLAASCARTGCPLENEFQVTSSLPEHRQSSSQNRNKKGYKRRPGPAACQLEAANSCKHKPSDGSLSLLPPIRKLTLPNKEPSGGVVRETHTHTLTHIYAHTHKKRETEGEREGCSSHRGHSFLLQGKAEGISSASQAHMAPFPAALLGSCPTLIFT